jgi:hypothetical protein
MFRTAKRKLDDDRIIVHRWQYAPISALGTNDKSSLRLA